MRIFPDKIRMQAFIIALPLVLALAAGGYYYFFVLPRHGVSHEAFLVPDTAVRAVVKPALVQSYVSSLAPAGTRLVRGIPKVTSLQQFSFRTEWVHKMPFEFTFLLDQRSPDFLGVSLFVQEHPASESFSELVNDSAFFQALYPILWERPRMMRQGPSRLLAVGTLPIPNATRDRVSAQFPDYIPFDAPAVTGEHFVEIAVDNRNGAFMELQGALTRMVSVLNSPELEYEMNQAWPSIETARLTADLQEDDVLSIGLEIYCLEGTGISKMAEVLDGIAGGVEIYLASRHGFGFEGAVTLQDEYGIKAEYNLTGFEERLRRALGG